MSANDPDSLDPHFSEPQAMQAGTSPSEAPNIPNHLPISPLDIPSSSQNQNQYLSNSPLETRHSASPLSSLDPRRLSHDRHPFHDPRLFDSPISADLNLSAEEGMAFPEFPAYFPRADPSYFPAQTDHDPEMEIHVRGPSDEHEQEQEQDGEMPTAPPGFAPFFTLITDLTMGGGEDKDGNPRTPTIYHPNKIHYIFTDDEDCDALKEAYLRCLPGSSDTSLSSSDSDSFPLKIPEKLQSSSSSKSVDLTGKGKGKEKEEEKKKGKEKEREERVIIIDMNETGDRVRKAQSLSSKWQVMGWDVRKAPIWEGEGGNDMGGGGLMLRVEGCEISARETEDLIGDLSRSLGGRKDKGKGKGKENEEEDERKRDPLDMDRVLEGLDRRMSALRKVVEGVGWDTGIGERERGVGMGIGGLDGDDDGDGNGGLGIMGPAPEEEEETEDMRIQRYLEKEGEAFDAS